MPNMAKISEAAGADPAATILSAHQTDLAYGLHPQLIARELTPLLETLLPLSQLFAVALTIAGLIRALQREAPPMESIAHRLLLAALIATVPVWRSLAEDTGDALAAALGPRAVPEATLLLHEGAPPKTVSPLFVALRQLAEQWSEDASPIAETLDEQRPPKAGQEEAWLATGWNWAKGAYGREAERGPAGWASTAGTARAGLLRLLCLGATLAVLACLVALYAAEIFRCFLFQGGCALLPLALAALGSRHWRSGGLRFLGSLAAVTAWPAAWALAHVGTLALARQTLEVLQKTAASALNPKPTGLTPTIALAAPWLSWSLLAWLLVLTLAVCGWCIVSLGVAPYALHRLCAGGIAWLDAPGDRSASVPSAAGDVILPATAPTHGDASGRAATPYILTSNRRTPSEGGSACGTSTSSVRALSTDNTAERVKIWPLNPTRSAERATAGNSLPATASASDSNGRQDSHTTSSAV